MQLRSISMDEVGNGGEDDAKPKMTRKRRTRLNAHCLYEFRVAWKQGVRIQYFAQ